MAHNIKICKDCKNIYLKDEMNCPSCGKELTSTQYTDIYWSKCSEDKRREIVFALTGEAVDDKNNDIELTHDKQISGTSYNSSSSVGSLIKIVAAIVTVLSCIGAFIIGADAGIGTSIGLALVCFLFGLLAYGIGEICTLLTDIREKIIEALKK